MKIALASDHAGFQVKETLKQYLKEKGYQITDCGTPTEDRSDYPDFGFKAARLVSQGLVDWGVLICGSGAGMCMVANRLKGVRAVVLRNENEAVLAREHNDANVACFGARLTDLETIKKLTNVFLGSPFGGGRHKQRVEKIDSQS
ncbi:MAG: ribose 5-phosphate isomerase B [Pseudomonadota bacterium]